MLDIALFLYDFGPLLDGNRSLEASGDPWAGLTVSEAVADRFWGRSGLPFWSQALAKWEDLWANLG